MMKKFHHVHVSFPFRHLRTIQVQQQGEMSEPGRCNSKQRIEVQMQREGG